MANIYRGAQTMVVGQTMTVTIDAKNEAGDIHGFAGNQYTWAVEPVDNSVVSVAAGADAWEKIITAEGEGPATLTITGPDTNTEVLLLHVYVHTPGVIGMAFDEPVTP